MTRGGKKKRRAGKDFKKSFIKTKWLTGEITQASKWQWQKKAAKEKTDDGSVGVVSSSPGSMSSLSASSPLCEFQALDQFLATGRMPTAPSKVEKPHMPEVKERILKALTGKPMEEVCENAGIHGVMAVNNLVDHGLLTIITLFCEGDLQNSKPFRDELKNDFGVASPDSMKSFLYFNELLKRAAVSSPPLLSSSNLQGIVSEVTDV